MSHTQRQIFQDASGRRWLLARAVLVVIVAAFGLLLGALVWDALAPPDLPGVPLAAQPRQLSAAAAPKAGPERASRGISSVSGQASRYGFYVNWDDNSFVSLKRNAANLDVLAPEFLHLQSAAGDISPDDPSKETRTRTWLGAHAAQLAITPLINNFSSRTQNWNGQDVARLSASARARAQFIAAIRANLAAKSDAGLNLDFEQVPKAAMTNYVTLVRELAAGLHADHRTLDVSVPVDDEDYAFADLAAAADHLVLMAYDENTADGDPGPLAGQGWFEHSLDRRFANVDAAKLIVAIGSYGYDWRKSGHGEEITVQDAWRIASESEAAVRFDGRALNPSFGYREDDRSNHSVWFLDAASAFNQTEAALSMRPAGVALWRLGSEDPGVWSFFARGHYPDAAARTAMQTMQAGYDLVYEGDGEALKVTGAAKPGARRFGYNDADRLITDETIATLPQAVTLTRWGKSAAKTVALTFDDGPDPAWTPGVLDALKAAHAPATFFLIGGNALAHPDLLRRIVAEGHDIGSHSFTHPNISELPDAAAAVELNATERTFEALAGVRPLLFRPPYAEDIEPETIDDAQVVNLASRLGYVTLGLRVDPNDWRTPGVNAIVQETVEQIERGEGHVVLLHDSGGDRSQTIAAIPLIVSRLRADGYSFVTAHELLGLPRTALMAPGAQQSPDVMLSRSAFWAAHDAEALMGGLFVIGLALGFARFGMIGALALFQAWTSRARRSQIGARPSVAVIVPAYNEEKVVIETVRSILQADRSLLDADAFEILVIDDGSRDRTADVARAAFAAHPQVRVLRKPNGGKASAINFGIAQARADIIVVIDADTVLDPKALGLMARHFSDPTIGAVAGNAKVGNRINWITRFQALEYITSQNLDRRAFEALGAISVVPGAIGAWRRSALLEIGGFAVDTLAEDADATIKLQRFGWRVLYEPAAIARTEAPESLLPFMKQRFRWMFGTLQAAFKHRDAPLHAGARRFGWTLLPNVVVFQVLFPLISPVMDGLLVASVIAAGLDGLMHAGAGTPSGLVQSLQFYALFQAIELAGAAMGFAFDPGEDWRLLPLAVAQRFCYRQLLYVTAIRALLAAIKGGEVGWGKLARTARLKAAPASVPAGQTA
jgi:cellulose synthase/poly-beta-1,6-N-acetylglucosamine synthase-like glycosyltransferase/peptidoglycan/xylan/chitin deacetylase (PgdA/CDA1 family)/spore germination protein YaaH